VRAFAVLAVMAFHNGFSWIPGGYYGVDVFFVLSGFLITSLLLVEWEGTGTVALGRFWARRARRLLPALFVLLAAIGLVAAIWPTVFDTTHLLTGGLAATFYVANWYFGLAHVSYFGALAQPSPLLHTWSLAIEEQFYLVWPLVVLLVVRGWRRRAPSTGPAPGDRSASETSSVQSGPSAASAASASSTPPDVIAGAAGLGATRARRLEVLLGVAVVGALCSTVLMAMLSPSGGDPTRAYYGTDTRAQGLLVGAAIAAAFARWGAVRGAVAIRAMAGVALAGVLGTAVMWWRVPETSFLAFHGGFLLVALSAGAVIGGVVQAPGGLVARGLAWTPLRALGRISYGVYLWYWPVLLVVTGERVHASGWPLFGIRLLVTVTFAALSYRLVERPIRHGVLPGWRALIGAPIAAGIGLSLMLVATVLPAAGGAADAGGAGVASPTARGLSPERTVPSAPAGTPGAESASVPGDVRPTKVLLVGDSVAGSLGVGLAALAPRYGVELVNEGSPGCSLSMDQLIRVLWYTISPGQPCRLGDPGALLAQWRRWVDTYNPDVVVYLARGELFDQELGGTWSDIESTSFDRYLQTRFEEAVRVLGARGARVVLLTTPYYDSGEQPSGTPWPEDAPDRVSIDNRIILSAARTMGDRAVPVPARLTGLTSVVPTPRGDPGTDWLLSGGAADAPEAPDGPSGGASVVGTAGTTGTATTATTADAAGAHGQVAVFTLSSLVSPGERYDRQVHDVTMRCADGVHFTMAGGEWVAARLMPGLVTLGQAHHAASPSGSWPVALPQAPSWWNSLPCG